MYPAEGQPVLVLDPAADPAALCARLATLLAGCRVVVCDAALLAGPDAATLDTLARLRLTAYRLGGDIRVVGARPWLRDLVAYTGLAGVLPVDVPPPSADRAPSADRGGPAVQVVREAEQRKQPTGVQERVERGDPAG